MMAIARLIRPILALALVASAFAVVVSRSSPPRGRRMIPVRQSPILVGPPRRDSPSPATVWLEGDSGRTILMPAPGGKLLEFGVCSPWRDDAGRSQVAGRLSCRQNDPSPTCIGLARVAFPEGRLLDFVATDVPPVSRPCWFPGTWPRVLFAAGDGRLYRCDFEAEGPGGGGLDGRGGGPRAGPRRIVWRCLAPGRGDAFLSCPSWPSDPRFDPFILAVIKPFRGPGRQAAAAGDQIWWLRLDGAGDAIVEAGMLLDASTLPGDRLLCTPEAGRAAGGGMALAYLSAARGGDWELRSTPLSFDASGRPRALSGPGAKLAGRCRADFPPAFAADGRHVTVLQSGEGGRGRIIRLPLPESGATSPITDPGASLASNPMSSGED